MPGGPGALAEAAWRILCVDDHPLVRAGLRAVIEARPGWRIVGEAGCVRDAMTLGETLRPDLLLVDVRLPDGDGLRAAAALRERRRELRVVVLSAYAGDETVYRALDAGADAFVLKEHAEAEIAAAIEAVARGRRHFSASATELLCAHGPRVALTVREQSVLRAMALGLRNKDMARRLGISEATARTYVAAVCAKFGCHGRQETVASARARGFLTE